MKRLIVLSVAALVLSSAGAANAGFMYFLEPVSGTGYTISTAAGTNGVKSYSVSITQQASSGAVEIPFVIYAAVPASNSSSAYWGGNDFLSISNTGTSLKGTFDTNYGSWAGVENNAQKGSGWGAVQLAGDFGSSPNNAAGAFFSGGLQTITAGVGTVGGTYTSAVPNLSASPNWYNYITVVNAGFTHGGVVAETSAGVSGKGGPQGSGYFDIPLGTTWYTYTTAGLTTGANTQIDIHQAYMGTDASPVYSGAYQSNGTSYSGQQSGAGGKPDKPVTITYNGSNAIADNSILNLNPSTTLSLGRLLLGSTGYISNDSGGALTVTTSNNTGFTISANATSGNGSFVTAQTNFTGLALGGTSYLGQSAHPGPSSGYLNIQVGIQSNATPGATFSGTLNVANIGNSGDTGGTKSLAMSGSIVQQRQLTLAQVQVASNIMTGTVLSLAITGDSNLDSSTTIPTVTAAARARSAKTARIR
ncbi:MAG: hypothetical protein ABR915_22275 [Thermoguttaceae bacterium]